MSADERGTDLLKTASARFIHARDSAKIKVDVRFEFVVMHNVVGVKLPHLCSEFVEISYLRRLKSTSVEISYLR